MLTVPAGSQVVLTQAVAEIGAGSECPEGSTGVVVHCPADASHSYRVRIVDGRLISIRRAQFRLLKELQTDDLTDKPVLDDYGLHH